MLVRKRCFGQDRDRCFQPGFSRACSALAVAVATALGIGCADQRGAQAATLGADVRRAQLPPELTATKQTRLEEPPGVTNVRISVSPDPLGGYLVADAKERQIRRYSADGQLMGHFGETGSMPGQFSSPVMATLRLPNGDILTGEANGRISRFTQNGQFQSAGTAPVQPLYGMLLLDSGHVLLSGRHTGAGRATLLHEWNVTSETAQRSLFPSRIWDGVERRRRS